MTQITVTQNKDMNPETITVTINPDGTAREVNEIPDFHKGSHEKPSLYGLSDKTWNDIWEAAEAQLRTFDIEYAPCMCRNESERSNCEQICDSVYFDIFSIDDTFTATITYLYPEPISGKSGRIKILQ